MTKELHEAQKRCREINDTHRAAAVKVKGLKGDVIFECTGPRVEQCSVLVLQADGSRRRVMALLDDVTFPDKDSNANA